MTELSWYSLIWCAIPVAAVSLIYLYWQANPKELLIASLRMLVQLTGVGFVLVSIFSNPSPWFSLAIVTFMMVVASWISIRPVKQYNGFWFPALTALTISVGIHLGITVALVLEAPHWYEPRLLIPLAGMYFANTMNAVSLSAERYVAELKQGANLKQARMTAFHAAMIPQINGLLAVGVVALPGMMTGQILSGVSPLIAVRYQIMIMTMIIGTSGVGAAIMLSLLQKYPPKSFSSN